MAKASGNMRFAENQHSCSLQRYDVIRRHVCDVSSDQESVRHQTVYIFQYAGGKYSS